MFVCIFMIKKDRVRSRKVSGSIPSQWFRSKVKDGLKKWHLLLPWLLNVYHLMA